MNSAAHTADPASDTEAVDELLLWVAQRADQLAQKTASGRERDLENWLQAEQEMLARVTPSLIHAS
jgi:hypothetical protein